jgi:hypothetical protein
MMRPIALSGNAVGIHYRSGSFSILGAVVGSGKQNDTDKNWETSKPERWDRPSDNVARLGVDAFQERSDAKQNEESTHEVRCHSHTWTWLQDAPDHADQQSWRLRPRAVQEILVRVDDRLVKTALFELFAVYHNQRGESITVMAVK